MKSEKLAEIVRHVTENVTLLDLRYNAETIGVASRLRNIVNKKTGSGDPVWNAYTWDVA